MITAIYMLAAIYAVATVALALGIYEFTEWRRWNQRRAAAQILAAMVYVANAAARSAAPRREIISTAPAKVAAKPAAPVKTSAKPVAQAKAVQPAPVEHIAPAEHVNRLPVSGEVTRPFRGFTYDFAPDSITVAGLRYPVEYSVSRPQMSKIPTVTALYWTSAGRVALRIDGQDHLHSAAYAAAIAAKAAKAAA